MKTIFAIIGFCVCALWVYNHAGNKAFKSGARTAWNITAPYINNAVNGAQDKAKQAANR